LTVAGVESARSMNGRALSCTITGTFTDAKPRRPPEWSK
jgi:hypothetical protein